MNTLLEHAYICVRGLDANGLPIMPGAWTVTRVADSGWHDCRSADGQTLVAAWRANSVGSEALFALFGPKPTLDAFAAVESRCMPARELWELAKGGDATAITVVRRWPIWRFTGQERRDDDVLVPTSNVVRRLLVSEGQSMPTAGTAFPWRFAADGTIVATDGAAQFRVDGPIGSLRPALHLTYAGYELHNVCEHEPPR
jgi:hypothetical protein